MKGFLSLFLGLVLFGAGISSASAQILLSVQFLDPAGTAQSGFQSFALLDGSPITNPSHTYTDSQSAALTVQLFGGVGSRFSTTVVNSSQFTNANLFNSFAVSFNNTDPSSGNGSTTPPTAGKDSMEITGLSANTTYQIQLWSVDARGTFNGGAMDWWYDTSNGVPSATLIGGIQNPPTGTFPVPPNTSASNNLYSVTGLVTTNSSGDLILQDVVNSGNSGILNGFTLSAAPVPEPSTYTLMLGGLLALIFTYRRRQCQA